MESDDFKTALVVALQFFPGIKLKRENRDCASKACLSNEKMSSSDLFCRLEISDWLFRLPALSIGQKTELSLLRVFAELLQLYFTDAACLWRHFRDIVSLEQELNCYRAGCRRCLWPGALGAISLSPLSSALRPANASRNSANLL